MGAEVPGAGGRRAARAVGGARRRLLRARLRHHVSRPAAHAGGRARARDRPLFARRDVRVSPRSACSPASCPASSSTRWRRSCRRWSATRMPVQTGVAVAVDRADRARAAAPITGCSSSCSSRVSASLAALAIHRLASRRGCAARRPGTAAIPDPSPATQYTADSFAQPIRRVFGTIVFRAREHVDMPPPGDMRAGAASRSNCATSSGTCSMRPIAAGVMFAADRLNRLQFLTIRQLSQPGVRRAGRCSSGARDMALILDLAVQGVQMLLVLLLAPLLTGFVRKVKARLLRRRGPPLLQPYRDLVRLMRKEVVLADNASWLFRVTPYLDLRRHLGRGRAGADVRHRAACSRWSADLIAIIALLGSARFFLALAGLDVGTSFGGIGSSREVMIASLAEPAMIMIVFTRRAGRRLDPALDHRGLPGVARGRAARLARPGAGRARSWWRSPRMPASRSTTRRPTSSSPWCTRRCFPDECGHPQTRESGESNES